MTVKQRQLKQKRRATQRRRQIRKKKKKLLAQRAAKRILGTNNINNINVINTLDWLDKTIINESIKRLADFAKERGWRVPT